MLVWSDASIRKSIPVDSGWFVSECICACVAVNSHSRVGSRVITAVCLSGSLCKVISLMQPQSIQQINLAYDSQQDRLLLKAAVSAEQEIRVWLSYRIVRQMFKVLNQEAHLPVSTAALADAQPLAASATPAQATRQFEQEADAVEQLDALDFGTAYQSRASVVNDQALLAIDARFMSINDRLNQMQLACATGVNLNMSLNHELVLALSRMLMVASQEAGWGLAALQPKEPEAVSSIVMHVPTEKQVLH